MFCANRNILYQHNPIWWASERLRTVNVPSVAEQLNFKLTQLNFKFKQSHLTSGHSNRQYSLDIKAQAPSGHVSLTCQANLPVGEGPNGRRSSLGPPKGPDPRLFLSSYCGREE
jgi:hypothetical protein